MTAADDEDRGEDRVSDGEDDDNDEIALAGRDTAPRSSLQTTNSSSRLGARLSMNPARSFIIVRSEPGDSRTLERSHFL